MDRPYFINSRIDGDLSYFHLLATVTNAAMYMGVQSFETCFHFFPVGTQRLNCWVVDLVFKEGIIPGCGNDTH